MQEGGTMATAIPSAGQRLVLNGVDWRTYTRLLRALADRPALRLTYDRGALEIMTLSHEHENCTHLLGRLVVALTEELGLPVKGGRSTTFRRQKRRRGLEPDECYWIASEPLVRRKTRIDLRTDPPPDLALEIDITHSSLDRMGIYAALRVPEVWRLEGGQVVCHLLGAGGYTVSASSRVFPGLAPADLGAFLAQRTQIDENTLLRQFRAWIRQQQASGGLPSAQAP
jgi:Uma2 family endonuclease